MPTRDKLTSYRKKRRFDATPEPTAGDISKVEHGNSFVIHKHDASRLHYDLRLELDGVLKSWAVPKGPSSDPSQKRLAVLVEDHPLEYGKFEGVIPEGNYGAGTVEIWDHGTYRVLGTENLKQSVAQMYVGLKKGEIKLEFFGEKMQGAYVLVRMRDTKNWLLIKERDVFVGEPYADEQEIAQSLDIKDAPKATMPHHVRPMLCEFVDQPFDRTGWLFEMKWDGYRAIAEISESSVQLYSRNKIDFSTKYPEIVEALKKIKHKAVIDGEVVSLDAEGKSSFQRLQHLDRPGSLYYYVFDLLYLDGHDLTSLPLARRKQLLQALIPKNSRIRLSDHVEGSGKAFFSAAKKNGLEGVIAKDAASVYEQGQRSAHWLKIKIHAQQEVVVAGFTEPRGTRKGLGALIGAVYEGDKLQYVGHIGGIARDEDIVELLKHLKPFIQKDSPFTFDIETNMPVTWVKPKLVVEVKFAEWTDDGRMRQPIFLGIREDKKASEVVRESYGLVEVPKNETGGKLRTYAPRDKHDADGFTHLEKIFWPKTGYTKADLLSYYREIAPVILPYLRGRPMSLHRQPNGIIDDGFFQKDVEMEVPSFVHTTEIESESAKKIIRWITCENVETLLYLANLGCIDLHPWNSRISHLDNPDYAVLDLDPHGVGFGAVVKTAQVVHEICEEVGIPSVCKTSGLKGLHVFIPLAARYTTEQIQDFTKLLAFMIRDRLPKIVSLEFNPEDRKGKIYIDVHRNPRGQTTVAAYSLRPHELATVSTPLRWEEVSETLDPMKFTMKTIFKRLDKVGDLWKPVLGKGIDMKSVIVEIEKRISAKI